MPTVSPSPCFGKAIVVNNLIVLCRRRRLDEEVQYTAQPDKIKTAKWIWGRAAGIYLYVKMPRGNQAGKPTSCDDLSRRAHLG
jgi:hypothetical protein